MVGKATEAVNEATFESNLAQRVVERFVLSPPVDVAIAAERYADVECRARPAHARGST
jgi:hypothetical protein